jgi:hypothetical protein
MKKIIIGLLLLAVSGGAVYYFLSKKPAVTSAVSLNKDLLIGKWKLDTLDEKSKKTIYELKTGIIAALDSNILHYEYDIQKDGKVYIALPGKPAADSAFYEWAAGNQLNWIQNDSVKTKDEFAVLKLDSISLSLQTKDSSLLSFIKLK